MDNVLAWNYVFHLWTFTSTLKHNTMQCIIQNTVKTVPHINMVHWVLFSQLCLESSCVQLKIAI